LIESTRLPFAEIALAAGFGSIRQFNDTVREIYARTPSDLRERASKRIGVATPGQVDVDLSCRQPFDATTTLAFLGQRAIPGLEEVTGPCYRRSLRLPHGGAIVELKPEQRNARCSLRLDDLRDLTAAVARCRRLLDLDADPTPISELLGHDKVMRRLVARRPGLRVPGCVDGEELAIRALVGQQISARSARSLLARIVERLGNELGEPAGAVSHYFPAAQTLAAADPATLPMPRARAGALQTLCRQLASGEITLDAGTDQDDALARLRAIHGIGPWTASYIAMRALGDPDVFLPTDLGVRRALQQLGRDGDPNTAQRLSRGWRPWRSYAVLHLWSSLGDRQTTTSENALAPHGKSRRLPANATPVTVPCCQAGHVAATE
jgi:AraC family transcriptional regulator of adaptative response / DNA-3-methyladenine glycosylase II